MKLLCLLLVLCLGLIGCGEKPADLPNWYTNDWFAQYKRGIIEMEHPYRDLSEIFPFIETWDKITSISAGINWVRVKDKRTNDEYEMARGTRVNQWLFKKQFCGYYNDKLLEKFVRWHFTGDLPDWLEIEQWEIKWREKELKRLKERTYD